jgi:geranylgeranyl diphosphate synthase type II
VNLPQYLRQRQRQIERSLQRYLPASRQTDPLNRAMRYSVFSGGKRIRPILALAACDAVGGKTAAVLPFACALELIHTYSLIHDDLPAMDDDDLRRGKPTSHVVFGEAMAILAGDALLTEAFRIMAYAARTAGRAQDRALQVLGEVACAAGARGMVAGQAADIAAENTPVDLDAVESIHGRKTGALIRAAVRAGALLGMARQQQLLRLSQYADCVGLAFQIADDLLDVEGSVTMTGKMAGRDRARHKATFPAVLGIPATRTHALDLVDKALHALTGFDKRADPLRAIAPYIVRRACPS